MQSVSQDYLTSSRQALRGRRKLEVELEVENLTFKEVGTVEVSTYLPYSQAGESIDIYTNETPDKNYTTLEENFAKLDDSMPLLPDSQFDYQPIIFSILSDIDGCFDNATAPKITIYDNRRSLEYLFNSIGVSLKFDSIAKDYASEYKIKYYAVNNDSEELIKETTETNTSVESVCTDTANGFNKMEIIFTKTNKPYRRLRLQKIFLGLLIKYDSNQIVNAKQEYSMNILSNEITDNTFEITIDNSNYEYNPDSPSTKNIYFQERQMIKVRWFYEVSDNVYEEINGGKYFLTGTPLTEERKAIFKGKGLLYHLSDEYKYGTYQADGISYYDLLEDIFDTASYLPLIGTNKPYRIDNSLHDISTNIPLPVLPRKELIQLICNATNMVMYEDRDGYINIIPNNQTVNSYIIDLDNQKAYPSITTLPKLRNINTKVYSVQLGESGQNIHTGVYTINGTKTLKIDYKDGVCATNIVAGVSAGTITNALYYAYYCELTVTTTSEQQVTVNITGTLLEINNDIYTYNVNESGEDCEIDNPLINSNGIAENISSLWETYLTYRNTYDLDYRGENILDLGDIIQLQTQFSNSINAQIISNKLEYDGGLKGKLTVKGLI